MTDHAHVHTHSTVDLAELECLRMLPKAPCLDLIFED